jgi:hypothetical protein
MPGPEDEDRTRHWRFHLRGHVVSFLLSWEGRSRLCSFIVYLPHSPQQALVSPSLPASRWVLTGR